MSKSAYGESPMRNEPEVLVQIQRLTDRVEAVKSRVDSLVNRLSFVLGPAYPVPKVDGANVLDPLESSPLAQNIRSIVGSVEQIEATINQTLSRLEVG